MNYSKTISIMNSSAIHKSNEGKLVANKLYSYFLLPRTHTIKATFFQILYEI